MSGEEFARALKVEKLAGGVRVEFPNGSWYEAPRDDWAMDLTEAGHRLSLEAEDFWAFSLARIKILQCTR
ncbi:MAG: hypothetical protein AB1648_01605 [Pseudomonadota bacterium]|jgi:hypothetical protein